MRTTANIAAVTGYGTTDYAGAAKVAKNIVLFAAAPFIGLAYALTFPFVGLVLLARYGYRALKAKVK